MALILPGPLAAAVSGSIGGTVFSHNRGGMYVRNRSTPTNPNSAGQQAVRAAMAAGVVAWGQVLSAVQRDQWDAYAAVVTKMNALGQSKLLTGQQWYVASSVLRERAGLDPVLGGPAVMSRGATDPTMTATASELTQQVTLNFDDELEWASTDDAGLFIQTGNNVSQTTEYYKGPFRFAETVAGNATTPAASPETFNPKFTMQEGQRVYVRATILEADGRYGEAVIIPCDVAA